MRQKRVDLSILIPCLNEKTTIVQAVAKAQQALKKNKVRGEVIVADNGSTDGTIELLKKKTTARVVHVPIRGYGAALHWGILKARSRYVLFADADLSYNFAELRLFIPHLQTNNFDLILGSRFTGTIRKNAMPFLNKYLGTPILTWLIRTLYRLPVTDSNSGMRAVRTAFYKTLHIRNAGMEWASELLIKTALYKGRYTEVPITLYPDKRNKPPHLVPWADGWRHLKAILLLKPNILFVPALVALATLLFFFPEHPIASAIILFIASGITLAVIAAKMLQFAIDANDSFLATLMLKLPLVQLALLSSAAVTLFTLITYPYPGIELLVIWSELIMFLLWVFFIETIKTHAINRLPDTFAQTVSKKNPILKTPQPLRDPTWSLNPNNQPTMMQKIMSNLSWQFRERQYQLFLDTIRPSAKTTILDVGVRPEESLSDSNFFEKRYPYQTKLTAASIEDCRAFFKMKYPKISFRKISANKKLPFKNNSFDVVVAWATLEHTGTRTQQAFFLKELLRVGKKVFITTPDKLALYDPHTNWFFLHWLPDPVFRKLCTLLGKKFWSEVANVNPLSYQDLRKLLPERTSATILRHTVLKLLPAHLIVLRKG